MLTSSSREMIYHAAQRSESVFDLHSTQTAENLPCVTADRGATTAGIYEPMLNGIEAMQGQESTRRAHDQVAG